MTNTEERVYTEEEIAAAKEYIEKKREEVWVAVPASNIADHANLWLFVMFGDQCADVIEFRRKRTQKYMDALVSVSITNPAIIKVNQDVLVDIEKQLEWMPEDHENYEALRANRLATINQIYTLKEKIADEKSNLAIYEEILWQVNNLILSINTKTDK